MGSQKIKVIKAKLMNPRVEKIKKIAISNGEKLMNRKITSNINNWIEEHRQKKNNMQLSFLTN